MRKAVFSSVQAQGMHYASRGCITLPENALLTKKFRAGGHNLLEYRNPCDTTSRLKLCFIECTGILTKLQEIGWMLQRLTYEAFAEIEQLILTASVVCIS